eukprot:772184_1
MANANTNNRNSIPDELKEKLNEEPNADDLYVEVNEKNYYQIPAADKLIWQFPYDHDKFPGWFIEFDENGSKDEEAPSQMFYTLLFGNKCECGERFLFNTSLEQHVEQNC